jgi:tetratricopeptide (TPR) repeat protein
MHKGLRIRFAIAGLLVGAIASEAAVAADCESPRKGAETMSEAVYRGVEEATTLLSEEKHSEAISKFIELSEKGSDYEKAIVNYNLGFAYSSKNDYANSVKAFSKALALNALPQKQHEQLQYNLGQLYIVAERYDEGIQILQQYVSESCSPVAADAHIFLANALAERKRYREALPQVDLAVSKAKVPKEGWLQLKLAINYELKDFNACAHTLIELIGLAPIKPEYWKQLSSLFYEMKQDAQSLAALALAERQGFISKPNEINNLFNVYMALDLPLKAGTLMQDAIDKGRIPGDEKNLESVANAWINAREVDRAEVSLKKLADMSDRGEYYFRLGAMYGDEERWKESQEMLNKSLEKGGLKRPGDAWMRLAVAHHNLQNAGATRTALQKALTFDESRKQAGEWLRHLGHQMTTESQQVAASR